MLALFQIRYLVYYVQDYYLYPKLVAILSLSLSHGMFVLTLLILSLLRVTYILGVSYRLDYSSLNITSSYW